MSLHKSNMCNLNHLTEVLEKTIPGFAPTTQLQRVFGLQHKCDEVIQRRLLILQEQKSASLNARFKARIRVSVSASFEIDTPVLSSLEDQLGVPASGTMLLKVTGSRIDAGVQAQKVPFFTSYFDKVGARISGVDFQKPISPTWDRFSEAEKNGLHVKLKTLGPINVEVYVKPRYPLYELKERLLLIPGNRRVDSLENVIANVWRHVKRLQLLDQADCRVIRCDTFLQVALGVRLISFEQLRDRLLSHMKKHDYIAREFTFGYDWESLEHEQSFEFEVGLSPEMSYGSTGINGLLEKMSKDENQITALDTKTKMIADELFESIKKYELYNDFHEKPMEFLKNWLQSQKHDFEVVDNAFLAMQYGSTFSTAHRHSEFYQTAPEIPQAVSMYLEEKYRSEQPSSLASGGAI